MQTAWRFSKTATQRTRRRRSREAHAGTSARRRAGVPHRTRAVVNERHPVHVTLRALPNVPTFRSELVARIARRVFAELSRAPAPAPSSKRARRRLHPSLFQEPTLEAPSEPLVAVRRTWPRRRARATDADAARFHVVHHSLQRDHVHLIVEAADRAALSAGVRRLVIRLAKRINHHVRGMPDGKVWTERYHRRDLRGPTEVRRALVYVLRNGTKHGHVMPDRLDPYSSAASFSGWRADAPLSRPREPPVHPAVTPWTWLLGVGWRDGGERGPLRATELPRVPASPRA